MESEEFSSESDHDTSSRRVLFGKQWAQEFDGLSDDDTSESLSSDSEAAEPGQASKDSNRHNQLARRGRPIGSGKRRNDSSPESGDGNVPAHQKSHKKVKRGCVATTQLAAVMCCSWLCLAAANIECYDTITRVRKEFQDMTKSQQRKWILDYFCTHSNKDMDGDFTYTFVIGTMTVCFTAWQLVIGSSRATVYRIRRAFESGCVTAVTPNSSKRGLHSASVQQSIAWIRSYVTLFADKLPNTTRLYLPSCLTQLEIYTQMEMELQEKGVTVCSMSYFYRLWKKYFKHVAIPPVNRFAKCDKCTLIKAKLEKTKDKTLRKALKECRERHLNKQNQERQKYYKHAEKARHHKDKYLSCIIDGMDQSKTDLPHFVDVGKMIAATHKLKTHLTGVIVHGAGVYGFLDLCQWPHGSNLTMNILLRVLELKSPLPPVWYLQMDNCGRENKNRFVLALCCLLVELDIFRKIKIGFLMVGHTHEDVDQLFSRFSRWLTKHTAMTIDKLLCGFEKCYNPKPEGFELSQLYDISNWLIPNLTALSMHSKPHVFKIVKGENGKACIWTKKWSADREWQSCISRPDDQHLLRSHPQGIPKLLRPCYETLEVENLQRTVPEIFKYMKIEADKEWWRTWLQNMADKVENDSDDGAFEENVEGWFLPKLHCKQAQSSRPSAEQSSENAPIFSDISDEDNPIPPVCIGRKPLKNREDCTRPMEVGDLVLTDMLQYADHWPQMAKIRSLQGDRISVSWYNGSLNGPWKPHLLRKKGIRELVEWTEDISRQVVWKYGFELTGKNFIPKYVKDSIAAYNND